MTLDELIASLQALRAEHGGKVQVVVQGYEGGADDPEPPVVVKLVDLADGAASYWGRYDWPDTAYGYAGRSAVPMVYIGRV